MPIVTKELGMAIPKCLGERPYIASKEDLSIVEWKQVLYQYSANGSQLAHFLG
jgi:hypothetical protein